MSAATELFDYLEHNTPRLEYLDSLLLNLSKEAPQNAATIFSCRSAISDLLTKLTTLEAEVIEYDYCYD